MSALSQTPASVLFSSAAVLGPVLVAAVTIAKGQPCYLDPTSNTVKLIGAAVTAVANATQYGLAAYGAAAGQPVQLVSSDPACVLGATLSPGFPVQASPTAGSFTQTQADLSSTNLGIGFGSAVSSTVLNLRITIGGPLS